MSTTTSLDPRTRRVTRALRSIIEGLPDDTRARLMTRLPKATRYLKVRDGTLRAEAVRKLEQAVARAVEPLLPLLDHGPDGIELLFARADMKVRDGKRHVLVTMPAVYQLFDQLLDGMPIAADEPDEPGAFLAGFVNVMMSWAKTELAEDVPVPQGAQRPESSEEQLMGFAAKLGHYSPNVDRATWIRVFAAAAESVSASKELAAATLEAAAERIRDSI